MSRITGTDAANLIDAYNSLYAPQEEVELTEEQVQENFENWVNSLVEEGHDLSEFTWDDMYEEYITEIGVNFGGQKAVDKVRANYAAQQQSNARLDAARAQRFGGVNPVVKAAKGGVQGTLDKTTGKFTPAARPATPAPAARPATPAPAARPAPTTSTKPAPTVAATPARNGFGVPTAPMSARSSVGSATAPAAPAPARQSLAQQAAELRAMQAASRQRQGLTQSFDPFDAVLGHLIDEGYADTEEAAFQIMANMSEEWRESIVEAVYGRTQTTDTPADKKMVVTKADKTGNTKAWQEYSKGNPAYSAAAHLKGV